MASVERIHEHVARFLSGEWSLASSEHTDALWDDLCGVSEWTPQLSLYGQLDALQALAGSPTTHQGLLEIEEPTVITGDLIVEGNLECHSHTLVLGSVRCTGYVYSGVHDSLIVAGDVAAAGLEALRSNWHVGGSMTAETTWLSSYGTLSLRGALRTRLLVVQQSFEILGTPVIETGTRIDTDYLPKDADARARLNAVITIDDCLDGDGEFDSFALLRHVAAGKQIFRDR